MFRPTHLVILFAVVLCATAFPAGPGNPPTEGQQGTPGALPIKGQLAAPDKGDLETDAQTHVGYTYSLPPTHVVYDPYGRVWTYGSRSGWGLKLLY